MFGTAGKQAGLIILCSAFILTSVALGQDPFDGYTLFNPNGSQYSYLLDMDGEVVHNWHSNTGGGYAVYLLESGNLLRPGSVTNHSFQGGAGSGLVEEKDWDGNLVWSFTYSSTTYYSHHDVEPMPGGSALMIAWEKKTAVQATAAGRSQYGEMWPDHLIEVMPDGTGGGEIIWEWHSWDHLIQDYDSERDNYGVVADHPELLDVNLNSGGGGPPGGGDWLHINGVSYNPELDQIVISSHFVDEFFVIDHSTTTEEAAGHTGGNSGRGGDILYRWGKPDNYDAPGETVFDVIHNSCWIPSGMPGAGNILVFHNNEGAHASEIVEIIPPLDNDGHYIWEPGSAYAPSEPTWIYENGTAFYSNHLGSNQRLPNGNTLISESTSGNLIEVTDAGEIVWDHHYNGQVARSLRYAPDYPGLYILNPVAGNDNTAQEIYLAANYPNPFNPTTTIEYRITQPGYVSLIVYDISGRQLSTLVNETMAVGDYSVVFNAAELTSGVYFYRLSAAENIVTRKMLLVR